MPLLGNFGDQFKEGPLDDKASAPREWLSWDPAGNWWCISRWWWLKTKFGDWEGIIAEEFVGWLWIWANISYVWRGYFRFYLKTVHLTQNAQSSNQPFWFKSKPSVDCKLCKQNLFAKWYVPTTCVCWDNGSILFSLLVKYRISY